ncbi:hypothetical protein [Bacillus gaemokensis]|uniref:hypothetical protein n=1 Tax=Bacillus gaemokensis TaxID=574375 RepID=UPI000535679E|nr:hypothetical protein [Bacillus gaemokensis]KYG38187.1 hypothetical protein AZF08_19290 [Bacillus gaemokensis]
MSLELVTMIEWCGYKIPRQIEAKAVLYSVWIRSNKDSLEVVQGDSKYVHVSNEDSDKLFEAIIETKLSNVK